MQHSQPDRRKSYLLFSAVAFSIYAAIFLISRSKPTSVVGLAATFDLTITCSAAFYFALVRRGHAGWLGLVTVALAGLRVSSLLFSGGAVPAKWLAAPLELMLILNVVRRLRHVPAGDEFTRIRSAVDDLIANRSVAQEVAAEIIVFYYALFSWNAKPQAGFTSAKASGYSLFGILLIFGLVFEGIPLHLILMRYSPTAAWIAAGLDVYGLVWAVALLRANRLRAYQMDAECLRLRAGLIWEADIRWRDLAAIRPFIAGDRVDVKAVFLNTPQMVIELRGPVKVTGLYGIQRTAGKIAIAVDDLEGFRLLASRHFGAALQPPVIGFVD